MSSPDFDARLRPGAAEFRLWAQEDKVRQATEAAYDLNGHELAEIFGDKFIFFLNELVEEKFNEQEA